jgi:uncharacterized membrane protein
LADPRQPLKPAPSSRLAAIDLLRGAVMIVMLLDHARDFVHRDGLTADPSDPRTTTAALFFTRWITHFCAPVFVFLAGLSVRLQVLRGGDRAQLGNRLMRRGCSLVLLELVVLRPLIWFQFDYSFAAHLQVIWAIGWAMVALGVLLRVGTPAVAIGWLGVAIVAGHNLLPHAPFPYPFPQLGSAESVRLLLFSRGAVELGERGPVAFAQYAIVPWLGVMLLGFAIGAIWALPAERRRRWLLTAGLAATAAFVLMRAFGLYGDPSPWSSQPTAMQSLFSFLRLEKYPPSLQYLLMTLGPALVVLAAAENVRANGSWSIVIRLGRVPMFFYVLQWPAVHLTSRLFQWLDGQPIGWDAPNPITLGEALPPGCGFSLPGVYLAWGLCLCVLVPLTLAYDAWERRRRALPFAA